MILALFLGGPRQRRPHLRVHRQGRRRQSLRQPPARREPAVTADVARALAADDAKGLSNLMDMTVLQQLQTASNLDAISEL